MATYACYGITLRSAIELPELGPPVDEHGEPDIRIDVGPVGPPPHTAVELGSGMWRDPGSCGFVVDDVARFEIHAGRHIVVDHRPGAPLADVRLFLLGTALGAAMMQRGNLVLHGNAIRVGDACAVVVGHSGAGKSTLAAEFARRGIDVLSDDVVPIDPAGRALPGYPRIKLWEDALTRLGRGSRDLERVRAHAPKYSLPITRTRSAPLEVRWVYSLETHDGSEVRFAGVSGIEKFELLSEHTYRPQLIHDSSTEWQHAQQCAALGARAQVTRVLRPRDTMTPDATADAVLSHLSR